VIGIEAYRVEAADALRHVAGYVIANDLTTRDRVFRPDMPGLGTDWLAGKNAPTFLPLGPWLVPAPFVPDPAALRVTLKLNGQTMQDETTADMIFGVPELIAHVSAITPLRPGDLLLTGSPAGNGAHYGRYLQPGDVMESTITGGLIDLGTQHNRCVAP
jgi:2-keto-4-pentenoate hydratase/2-oxohepta-3-ene-1,7-dioic acid hydratase in catechol pathway